MKLVFFLFCQLLFFGVYAQNSFEGDFYQLSTEEFLQLEKLNRPIEFSKVDYPLLHAAIFHMTNLERIKSGLSPLSHSLEVQSAAAGHAGDMVTHRFYSHSSPVKSKKTVGDRIALEGIQPKYYGENISKTFAIRYEAGKKIVKPKIPGQFFYSPSIKTDPIPPHSYHSFAEYIVLHWMNSPGHRQNILNPNFTHLGCGAAFFLEEKFYSMPYFITVQNFIGN